MQITVGMQPVIGFDDDFILPGDRLKDRKTAIRKWRFFFRMRPEKLLRCGRRILIEDRILNAVSFFYTYTCSVG
jgi:hypothetical protein